MLLPLRGVLLASFDTPPSYVCKLNILLRKLLQLSSELQQREVRHLIVEVRREIVVLRVAHAHLVLQHLGH